MIDRGRRLLVLLIGFFLLSGGLVVGCDKLRGDHECLGRRCRGDGDRLFAYLAFAFVVSGALRMNAAWMEVALYFVLLSQPSSRSGPTWPESIAASRCGLDRALRPIERLLYRGAGVRADDEMSWTRYARRRC